MKDACPFRAVLSALSAKQSAAPKRQISRLAGRLSTPHRNRKRNRQNAGGATCLDRSAVTRHKRVTLTDWRNIRQCPQNSTRSEGLGGSGVKGVVFGP